MARLALKPRPHPLKPVGLSGVCMAIALMMTPVQAAQIAVDVDRKEILVADAPDAIRHPASLVKLMTAYIAFAALEAGEITDDEAVTISAKAARQPPVRLRIRKGQKIPFGDLLAATAIGSKNDAAVAVADAIAGDETAFVARMNAAAARLGMVNTRYANASGLPAPGQHTTARDVAILAQALLTEHPERSTLFSERGTRAGGRRVTTTNPLFGRVLGAQGMKTGFTCAAGYNIAGLVERDGRRVLAVTLGHKRKAARLTAVKALIDDGFDRLGQGKKKGRALAPGAPVPATAPDIGSCKGGKAVVAKATPKIPDTYIPPPRPMTVPKSVLQPVPQRRAALPKPTPIPRALPRKPSPAPAPPPPPPLSGWAVSLGAFDSDRAAHTRLKAVNAIATKAITLPSKIVTRRRDNRRLGIIYGLSQSQARALCGLAKGIGQYCLTLSPQALLNPKARWRR